MYGLINFKARIIYRCGLYYVGKVRNLEVIELKASKYTQSHFCGH